MEKGFEVDFSEIINEEDDSWAFVDSNILESARQELEQEKKQVLEESSDDGYMKPIKNAKTEYNKYRHKTQINIVVDTNKNMFAEEPEKIKACCHSTIQPVFDCIYWSKKNNVVDNLIQK